MIRNSFSDMAQRMNTGRERLVACILEHGKCTPAEAERVAALYLREKLAKLSPRIGQFAIRHGALLDRDVIARAIKETA